jgi:small subunit ribosomal protein S8
MSLNDPISDMVARIRNAHMGRLKSLISLYSGVNVGILKVLKDEGYIDDYQIQEESNKKSILIKLRYFENEPAIKEIKRISKPGKRVYSSIKNSTKFRNGLGVTIFSTSKGILSDYECIKHNLGGEVLCRVF